MAEYNESQINSNETERISAEQQRIENNTFTSNSNLYWAGGNVITLKKYHTAKFISKGTYFILIGIQKDI